MFYTLTHKGMKIGYRLNTDYGDFLVREDAIKCDVFPNSSQVCIETSPGIYSTEDELSKGINIPDIKSIVFPLGTNQFSKGYMASAQCKKEPKSVNIVLK